MMDYNEEAWHFSLGKYKSLYSFLRSKLCKCVRETGTKEGCRHRLAEDCYIDP